MSTLYGPEFQDQDAYLAGEQAPHTAPMTHTAAMAHKIADLEAATHIGTTVAAELTRWRKIDRAAHFGGAAWHDATRRLRDVADRLEDAPEVDDAVERRVEEWEAAIQRIEAHAPHVDTRVRDAWDTFADGGAS